MVTVTESGFILKFGELLYLTSVLLQHPNNGGKGDRNMYVGEH
jgi:hypothetical protein